MGSCRFLCNSSWRNSGDEPTIDSEQEQRLHDSAVNRADSSEQEVAPTPGSGRGEKAGPGVKLNPALDPWGVLPRDPGAFDTGASPWEALMAQGASSQPTSECCPAEGSVRPNTSGVAMGKIAKDQARQVQMRLVQRGLDRLYAE